MKDDDKDYLGHMFVEQERRRERLHLTPRVLQGVNRVAVPKNMEVLQGIGGTVVYRRKFPTVFDTRN